MLFGFLNQDEMSDKLPFDYGHSFRDEGVSQKLIIAKLVLTCPVILPKPLTQLLISIEPVYALYIYLYYVAIRPFSLGL